MVPVTTPRRSDRRASRLEQESEQSMYMNAALSACTFLETKCVESMPRVLFVLCFSKLETENKLLRREVTSLSDEVAYLLCCSVRDNSMSVTATLWGVQP